MDEARLLVFGFAFVCFVCAIDVRGHEPEAQVFFEKKDSAVAKCCITLYRGFHQALDWRTKDVKLMKDLFLNSLENAKPDPKPAAYEILGLVTVTRKDGSEEVFIVFLPWGHLKRENAYLIADLGRLRSALKEDLKRAIRDVE
jgi:hypothetical protein